MIYNQWLEQAVVLNKGEIVCPSCKGFGGYYPYTVDLEYHIKFIKMCTHCRGQGKIDWITRVINPQKVKNSNREFLKSEWRIVKKEGENNEGIQKET